MKKTVKRKDFTQIPLFQSKESAATVPEPEQPHLPAEHAFQPAEADLSGYTRKRFRTPVPEAALNVCISTQLDRRLYQISVRTGFTKKDIVARALVKELDLIEAALQRAGVT